MTHPDLGTLYELHGTVSRGWWISMGQYQKQEGIIHRDTEEDTCRVYIRNSGQCGHEYIHIYICVYRRSNHMTGRIDRL